MKKQYDVRCDLGTTDFSAMFNGIKGVEVVKVYAPGNRADVLVEDDALHNARRRAEARNCNMQMRVCSVPMV